jgi:DNA-binding response OmpR family regulator
MMQPPILVVDHDKPTRDMMSAVLDDQCYAVLSRREANLGEVQSLAPALLIVDMHPPAPERCLALIRGLRGSAETSALPIIVTSTDPLQLHSHDLENQRCVRLAKPFDLEELLASVRHALCAASTHV